MNDFRADPVPSPPGSAIVFGGSGFIGGRLLRMLRDRGADRLVSADSAPPKQRLDGVDYRRVDVRRPIEIDEHFDVAYNLAAVHTTPGHEPHEYYEANIAGALNITDFARRNAITDIVFTSSISVYGPGEDQKDESTPTRPESDYGKSKLLAEQIHRTWLAEDPDRTLVVVRPAVVFGHGEGGNFDRMLKLVRARRFVYPGRKDTIKSCGYVGELVNSIEWVRARHEREVLYNFAYPERTTLQRIANAIAAGDGDPAPTWNLPLGAMMQAARAFEVVGKTGLNTGINRARILKLVRSTNVYPAWLVENGYPFITTLDSAIHEWLAEERRRSQR